MIKLPKVNDIPTLTYQSYWQSFCQKLTLNIYSIAENLVDSLRAGLVHQVLEHQAGKVRVKSLISRDQLIAECEARHEPSLLQPEDGGKAAGEENPHTFSIGCIVRVDPPHGPVSFLLDSGEVFNSIEESVSLILILNESCYELAVHLTVDCGCSLWQSGIHRNNGPWESEPLERIFQQDSH